MSAGDVVDAIALTFLGGGLLAVGAAYVTLAAVVMGWMRR